jgi:type 1 glutamine amidotransferase
MRVVLAGSLAAVILVGCGHSAPSGVDDGGSAVDDTPPGADAAPSVDRAPAADRATTTTTDTAEPPAPDAASAPADETTLAPDVAAAGAPATVLIFTHATGYVHDSRGVAAMAVKKALAPLGVTATLSEDPALITADKLAAFGALVLIDTTGKPFGDPGTPAIDAVAAFVRGGRGLVGIHAASNGYETVPTYVGLIGGDFMDHPGGVRLGHCQTQGTFPSVAKLPPTFSLVDEFYVFDQYHDDNLVDLTCDALGSTTQKLPIAWHRLEQLGRVFYTALGHDAQEWSDPKILDDHVIPGILWTLGRL